MRRAELHQPAPAGCAAKAPWLLPRLLCCRPATAAAGVEMLHETTKWFGLCQVRWWPRICGQVVCFVVLWWVVMPGFLVVIILIAFCAV